MNKIKNYFKRLWKALLDSTELDERAIAAIAEAKVRVEEMKKELADVKRAAKNVSTGSEFIINIIRYVV